MFGTPARRLSSVCLCALPLVLSLGTGCASYRIDVSLKPGKPPADAAAATKYNLQTVRFVASTNAPPEGMPDFGVYQISDAQLQTNLMAAALRTRPDLFADGPDAVPLEVTVTRAANESSMGADGCVSCLTLTIIPLRTTDKTGYTVEVTRPDPAGPRISAPVSFTRDETSWLSILPGGWIPVPGGSGERAWGTDSASQKTGEKMIAACIEAVVRALDRTEPSAWRTPPPPPPPAPAP